MRTLILWLLLAGTAHAFPTTPVLDTFTGADNAGPIDANWTNAEIKNGAATQGCALQDNAMAPINTGVVGCYRNVATYGPDFEGYGTIVNVGSTSLWGICRIVQPGNNTGDGYCVETEDATDTFTLLRLDNAVATTLGAVITPGGQVTVGDKFGISITGDQICAWFNDDSGGWVQLGCRTDSTYTTAGNLAVYLTGSNTVGALDDVGGGTFIATNFMQRRRDF